MGLWKFSKKYTDRAKHGANTKNLNDEIRF